MQLGLRPAPGHRTRVWRPPLLLASTPAARVDLGSGGTYGTFDLLISRDGVLYCEGHSDFYCGSGSGGNAAFGFLMGLPYVPRKWPAAEGPGAKSTDYFIGSGMIGQVFGLNDTPVVFYTTGERTLAGIAGSGFQAAGFGNGGWCSGVVGRQTIGGLATVTTAGATLVVTHGFGVAPASVTISPASDPNASSVLRWWVDPASITATQFTITLNAAPTAASFKLYWEATTGSGSIILGSGTPYPFASDQDHLEINYLFPIAA